LATTTSATFARAAQALRPDGALLFHTVTNEGGLGAELRAQLGERPYPQLTAAGPTMRAEGRRRSFLAGNDNYATAARQAGENEPLTVARELRRSRGHFPRGTVAVSGPETVTQPLYLAEAKAGGFALTTA
jgi:hypothetical protein